jgi:hypothetical protein
MTRAYKYQFRPGIGLRDVKDTLLLAFLAAEGVFGESVVRMDGGYSQDHKARTLTVDASTPTGQMVNSVFTTYVAREFGRDGFTVHRVACNECSCGPGPPGRPHVTRRVTGTRRSRESR